MHFFLLICSRPPQHEKHIVHRDLKAENVFFAGPRQVKVGDFGFSTNCAPDQTLSTFCGSPPYAAPELFRDDSYYGPNVDVWALGILLYFMVVGSLPFRAETVAKLKRCILEGVYPSPPERISDDCRFLIRGILRPAPSDRYSLAEIRDSDWLAGAEFPVAIRPYTLRATHTPPHSVSGVKENRPTAAAASDGGRSADDGDNASANGSIAESEDSLNECEVEARHQLEELGITEQHLFNASTRQSRSSVAGIYHIVLHSIEKRRMGEAVAAAAAAAAGGMRDAALEDGGRPEDSIVSPASVAAAGSPCYGGDHALIAATGKKRSNVCVIL